ncbi:ABC transporter ATP-binding protein [Rhodococcus fascians]|nr:ABC transporter ATP-binding protein [Rhodococcus fascians]MBY4238356.1 ABC transporter ATP-binding protein [Rhodococcus fascians]MBY4254263.1 ABC transporter ATP-binding protein [Rhodococcus fascians]MBY4269644.1 ABC transporter ATP-binding protein [Rhodococcus fascians]
MLDLSNLSAGYGVTEVLHNIDLKIEPQQVYAVCGPNGAGKSTLLRVVARTLATTSGSLTLNGKSLTKMSASQVVRQGIALCPEGRQVFPRMSTEENLQLGAYTRSDRKNVKRDIDAYFDLWPVIARRRTGPAGLLSGGEQQIVAIGRALMSNPSLLLLDEPSLGLAPVLIDQVYAGLKTLVKEKNLAVLLVEQNVKKALTLSERVAVLSAGRIVFDRAVADTTSDEVGSHYFHTTTDGAGAR